MIDKIFFHRLPDILYQKWNCKYGGHIITYGCWFPVPFLSGTHNSFTNIFLIVVIQTNKTIQQALAHNFHSFTRVTNQKLAQATPLIDLHGSGQIPFFQLHTWTLANSYLIPPFPMTTCFTPRKTRNRECREPL